MKSTNKAKHAVSLISRGALYKASPTISLSFYVTFVHFTLFKQPLQLTIVYKLASFLQHYRKDENIFIVCIARRDYLWQHPSICLFYVTHTLKVQQKFKQPLQLTIVHKLASFLQHYRKDDKTKTFFLFAQQGGTIFGSIHPFVCFERILLLGQT